MNKIYVLFISIAFFLFSFTHECFGQGQLSATENLTISNKIEGLRIYPNPVLGDKLFITSDSKKSKAVTVFNVLGKKVLFEIITPNSQELDVSGLNPGIYVLRIKEDEVTASKKLIIK